MSFKEEKELEELKQTHKLRLIEESRTDSIKDHEMRMQRLEKVCEIVTIEAGGKMFDKNGYAKALKELAKVLEEAC